MMHTFIQNAHKHILLASMCILALAIGTWALEGYMSGYSTSAAETQVDVSMSVIPYPTVVASGESAGFLLYYKTKGPGDAKDIQVTATLPQGMTLQSAIPASYTQVGNQFTWANLPDNYGPVVLEVRATGAESTQLQVQGSVATSTTESNTTNNTAVASIVISNTNTTQYISDVQASLTTASDDIMPGQQKSYTIGYQNAGPDTAAEMIIVMTIPNELTYVTGSRALFPMGSSNKNTLIWKVFDVPAGSGGTITATFLASNLLDPADTVFAYLTVTSTNSDPSVVNNQANKTLTVPGSAPSGSTTPPTQNNSPSQPQGEQGAGGAGAGAGDDVPVSQPSQEETMDDQIIADLPASSGFLFAVQSLDLSIPAGTSCAGPAELQSAYTFAHSKSITTMSSLAQARMCDGVIRSELAKMMSNYAINVLGKTPDTTRVCAFSDLGGQPQDLQEAAVTACQLGLMGLNADGTVAEQFNPKQTVTRAIFGTAFSRLLYGDMYNGAGSTWYDAHLAALASDGIIKNITPTLQELRGYIMIMMQRSAE